MKSRSAKAGGILFPAIPHTYPLGACMLNRTLVALGALALLASPISSQSLYYNGTYFLHGHGDPDRWTQKDVPNLMRQRIDLGSRSPAPYSYNPVETVDNQARGYRNNQINWYSGKDVLVGHSMGGVIARNLLLSPEPDINAADRIAGIVTVGSPNYGGPVVANARQWDPITAGGLIEGFFHSFVVAKLNPMVGLIDALAATLIREVAENVINNGIKKVAAHVLGATTPGSADLQPGSPTIQRLSSTPDNLPHASVYGTIPLRKAWVSLGTSFFYGDGPSWARKVDQAHSISRGCRIMFYNAIVKTGVGRACHAVDRAFSGVDERWNTWTHAGNKFTPTDGLFPRDYMLYPGEPGGSAKNVEVTGQDHFSIVYRPQGLDGVARGMLTTGMRPAQ